MMSTGVAVDASFGNSLLVCPPKKLDDVSSFGATVEASETRPLNLRNSDAKVIAGVEARMLVFAW